MIRKLIILSLSSAIVLAPLPAAADNDGWRGHLSDSIAKLRKWMEKHDWTPGKSGGGFGRCR